MKQEPKDARSKSRFVAFLRCTSCRFAAVYFMPFCGGLVQTGQATLGYAALGGAFWLLHSLGIEVTNRLADRTEDAINRPERTALCDLVGWSTLRSIQSAIWGGVLVLDLVWILLAGNLLLASLALAGPALGITYSRGPRFSRSRWFGFVTLNLLFGGAFLLGWSVGDPLGRANGTGWAEFADFVPMLTVVGLFMLALAGIKDITDRAGDTHIGYQSFFVDLVDRGSPALLGTVASMPFLAVLVFVLTGLLPVRMLAVGAFVPISAVVVSATRRTLGAAERLLIREAFYDYWLAFSSVALLLFLPRTAIAEAVVVTVAYWTLTTRWLHWSPQLGRSGLVQVVRIAVRSPEHTMRIPSTTAS